MGNLCVGNEEPLVNDMMNRSEFSRLKNLGNFDEDEEEDDEDEIMGNLRSPRIFDCDTGYEKITGITPKTNKKYCQLFRCKIDQKIAILEMYKKNFLLADDELYDEYKRGMRLMKVLRHENLLIYLGTTCSFDRRSVGILHEWSGHGLVEDVIDNQYRVPLKTSKKLNILLQVCNVMSYLHMTEIVHGSLSWNAFLFSSGDLDRIQLYDFGIYYKLFRIIASEEDEENPCREEFREILKYQAPEVANGREISYGSDVYSFSIMMYELISNNKFSPAKNESSRPPIDKSSVSKEPCLEWLVTLMEHCWDDEVTNRPSFQEIHEMIEIHYDETIENIEKFDELAMLEYHQNVTATENRFAGDMFDKNDGKESNGEEWWVKHADEMT